jgi:hypothetical protein
MLLSLAVAILFATTALAEIIRVPADQPTIQAAINAAAKGDTVLVAGGTYYENIDFKGKAITVASQFLVDGDTTHVNNTIINGSRPSDPTKGSVVSFVSGEDTTSVIYGFTITGGTGTLYSSIDRIGGGIYYENSGARIAHNKITANSITNTQRCWGGGIGTYPVLHDLHQVIIEDNVIESNAISGNDRTRGGGICLIQGKVIRNKIRSNSCSSTSYTSVGGGVFSYSDTTFHRALVIIEGNTITHNQVTSTASYGNGGGIDIQNSNVHLVDNVISHNQVGGGLYNYGAGVRLMYSKEISVVKGNSISFNSFVKGNCSGGGLYVVGAVGLSIQGNRFEENRSDAGGGTFVYASAGLAIRENLFEDNTSNAGGGIYCEKSNPAITGNTFRQNHAPYGGGIFSVDDNSSIANNLFLQNEAQWGGGIVVGATALHTYLTQVINNTFAGNVADSAGAVGLMDGEAEVMNSICWGDSAAFAPEIFVQGGTLHVAYSDIQSGPFGIEIQRNGTVNWLDGNIDVDPFFADTLCQLAGNSPCVDAGNPAAQYNDLDGSRNDMGAYGGPDANLITSVKQQNTADFIPQEFILCQNYPNPFNPTTTIEFALSKPVFVTLKIYNIIGEEVATLVSEKLPAGSHQRVWEANGLASGVYLYRLEAGDPSTSSGQRSSTGLGRGFVETKKLILLR